MTSLQRAGAVHAPGQRVPPWRNDPGPRGRSTRAVSVTTGGYTAELRGMTSSTPAITHLGWAQGSSTTDATAKECWNAGSLH
jgi:hypothetical protein